MSNLLIVGNGFDNAHGLDTRYIHFKEYLYQCAVEEKYTEGAIIDKPRVPWVHIYTKNGDDFDFKGDCKFLFWLVDDAAKKKDQADMEWNRFEELLGELDFCRILEESSFDEIDYMAVRDSLGTLENVFFDWIRTISIGGCSKLEFLETFINPEDDLIVNFNYTETAEVVYGVNAHNICHIHGKREIAPELIDKYHMTPFGADNRKLIVGHDFRKCNNLNERFSKYVDTDKYGMLVTLARELVKNTDEILYQNRDFFDKIQNTEIQNILSFGFSFSDVDAPQIQAICDALNKGENKTKNMRWYLNEYDNYEGKNERFIKVIKKCGYQGEFEIYNSKDRYIR